MRIKASLDEMLKHIGTPKVYEFVDGFGPFGVVAQQRGLKVDSDEEQRYKTFLLRIINSIPQNPSRLYDNIDMVLRTFTISHVQLDRLLHELIYNAICHGNQFAKELKIAVKIFDGPTGYIVSIEDQGKGFDIKEVLSKGLYERGGVGMLDLQNSPFYWDFQGSQLNLLNVHNPAKKIWLGLSYLGRKLTG